MLDHPRRAQAIQLAARDVEQLVSAGFRAEGEYRHRGVGLHIIRFVAIALPAQRALDQSFDEVINCYAWRRRTIKCREQSLCRFVNELWKGR
jgi:hypothetical protein